MAEARLPASAFTKLGASGPRISCVGFGCYRVDDRVAGHREALKLALRSGRRQGPFIEARPFTMIRPWR